MAAGRTDRQHTQHMELRPGESDVSNTVDCRINDFFVCVRTLLERSVGFECTMFFLSYFYREEAIYHRARGVVEKCSSESQLC